MRMLLRAQRTLWTMTAADAVRWTEWATEREREDVLVDSVAADDDPVPVLADTLSQLYGSLRHPRAFLRMIALDR
jgi:hypothetical protein